MPTEKNLNELVNNNDDEQKVEDAETVNDDQDTDQNDTQDGGESSAEDDRVAELEKQLAEAKRDAELSKKHKRDWESKSKKNLAELRKAEQKLAEAPDADVLRRVIAERDSLAQENAIFRGLTGMGADAARLMDSRSFMDKATALNFDDADFTEKLSELVAERVDMNVGGARLFPEIGGTRGHTLAELMDSRRNN